MDEVMMQEFMDANPGIEIEYEYVVAADAPTRISALLTAGELPDVFQTQASMYSGLVEEGALMDLSEAFEGPSYEGGTSWKDTYEEELLNNCESILKSAGMDLDSYSYGAPFGMITVAVLYDKTIYEELGLDVPTTWDEFIQNLDALKDAGYTALSIQNNTCLDWFPRLFWDQYCREEIEEQGKNFEDGSMTFQTESVREAMIQYKDLYDAGYFPENYLTGSLEEMEHLFIQGESAQLMVTPDKIQYILDNAPEGMQLASYALPGINGLPSRSLGGSSVILAAFCEQYGVRTAWHGPGDITPIGIMAQLHLDLVSPNFGIQEFNGFSDEEREVFPGCPEVTDGYMYPNDKPGFGIDVDEEKAKKYPCRFHTNLWTQSRLPDGTLVRP